MKAIDTALYGRLTTDPTLVGLGITGVFRSLAPQGQALPYVIFGKQDGIDVYTLTRRAGREVRYLVKAVVRGLSRSGAEDIAARIDILLTDQPLTLVGLTTTYIRRTADVDYTEDAHGVLYQHVGGIYRIEVV
jgi:hypothetical protein